MNVTAVTARCHQPAPWNNKYGFKSPCQKQNLEIKLYIAVSNCTTIEQENETKNFSSDSRTIFQFCKM
jgi:hypothetical protein